MKNLMEKEKVENKQTENKQPRTVIASKLRRTIETIDRDGNIIKRQVIEA